MLKKIHLLFVVICLALFAVAGCSDSDDDGFIPPMGPGNSDSPDIPGGSDPNAPDVPSNPAETFSATYNASFEGPGGHSNGAYGAVNAVHAAARAMVALETAAATLPATTKWTVSGFKGGNSVNSIAFDGFFTVTVSAAKQSDVDAFKVILDNAVAKGVADENAFRGRNVGDTNSSGGRIDVRGSVVQN